MRSIPQGTIRSIPILVGISSEFRRAALPHHACAHGRADGGAVPAPFGRMTTKQQQPTPKGGKPTIDQENHDKNIGQRERTATVPASEKETIGPDKHGNVGERGPAVISNDYEVE